MNAVNKSLSRKLVRAMLYLTSIFFAVILILLVVILANSAGKPKPFLDKSGKPIASSISEKIFVNINGVKQGMFIKGKDKTKPVLLFLHGGPGMPEYAVSREYPIALEDYFTVCWWEQRGAGLSFSSSIKPESLTFKQLISDVIEVTNYLRKRFGREKIYLMAHSGGSFIGIQAAAKSPELYYAYIGMSQISNQLESEKLAYKYMVEQLTKQDDKAMLAKFKKYPITKLNTSSYYVMRDAPMHKLGIGTTHKMKSVISGVFWPVMFNNEYTLSEKINIWRGKAFTTKKAMLWNKLVLTDLTQKIIRLEIPVYFFHGVYDYTVSYDLAMDYFNKLDAPMKGFYTFKHSAHSPLFEEAEKMKQILRDDVLKQANKLADKNI